MFEKISSILAVLERTPLSAKEISQETTLPLPTLYRHLKELQKYEFITKQRGKLYQLTTNGRQLLELLSVKLS